MGNTGGVGAFGAAWRKAVVESGVNADFIFTRFILTQNKRCTKPYLVCIHVCTIHTTKETTLPLYTPPPYVVADM